MGHSVDRSRLPWGELIIAGLVVALLDAIFASAYWGMVAGVPPTRIFQTVAAGWLGLASYAGGVWTAALGLASHVGISIIMVVIYAAIAARLPVLARSVWGPGLAYGVVLYAAMNYVVVPLSAAPPPASAPLWVASSVVMHLVIGVVCAFAATTTGMRRRLT